MSLNLEDVEARTILQSPQSYLSSTSNADAERIRRALTPAYRRGFRIIFLIGASLAALSFVLVWFLMPQVELDRPDDQKLKDEGKRWREDEKRKGENGTEP